MSKLFTPRALLIQLMLYLISRAIFSLVKSEMKTSKMTTASQSSAILTGSNQTNRWNDELNGLLDIINDK